MGKSKIRLLKDEELFRFCTELSVLVKGGVSLYDGLSVMNDEHIPGILGDATNAVFSIVSKNNSLYESFSSVGYFPEYCVHMIKVGEKNGRLETTLSDLASYYETSSKIRSEIKNSLAYPISLFGVMLVILSVLFSKILPLFKDMFLELSKDVANASNELFNVGVGFSRIMLIIVSAGLILFLVSIIFYLIPKTRRFAYTILSKFRGISVITETISLTRFLTSISILVSNGADIVDSLTNEAKVCFNPKIKEKILKCRDLCAKSKSFTDAVNTVGLLPFMDGKLLSVASQSGNTDEYLCILSKRYKEETSAKLYHGTAVLETVLIIMLILSVAICLASVIIPIVNLISMVG